MVTVVIHATLLTLKIKKRKNNSRTVFVHPILCLEFIGQSTKHTRHKSFSINKLVVNLFHSDGELVHTQFPNFPIFFVVFCSLGFFLKNVKANLVNLIWKSRYYPIQSRQLRIISKWPKGRYQELFQRILPHREQTQTTGTTEVESQSPAKLYPS